MILATALGVAILTVTAAYWISGSIWVERHSLRFKIGESAQRCSGAIGEIALVAAAAGLLWLIDTASPDTSIGGIFSQRPIVASVALLAVAAIVYVHGVRTALAAAPEEKTRLVFTYLVYGVFSTILFAGGAVLVFMIFEQIFADSARFQREAQLILSDLKTVSPDALGRALELSFLDSERLLATVEDSMAPVFIFMAGIFTINLAVRLTPLRTLFINNAVLLTHISTLSGVLLILGVGGWIYVGYYTIFIDDYLAALMTMRPVVADASPELLQRYSEIFLGVTEQKTLVGFITRMSNEWGGLAAILGIAQWLAEQFNRPEGEESSAHKTTSTGAS